MIGAQPHVFHALSVTECKSAILSVIQHSCFGLMCDVWYWQGSLVSPNTKWEGVEEFWSVGSNSITLWSGEKKKKLHSLTPSGHHESHAFQFYCLPLDSHVRFCKKQTTSSTRKWKGLFQSTDGGKHSPPGPQSASNDTMECDVVYQQQQEQRRFHMCHICIKIRWVLFKQ